MISRTFTRGEEKTVVSYPDGRDWKDRTVEIVVMRQDGEILSEDREECPSMRDGRVRGQMHCCALQAREWHEQKEKVVEAAKKKPVVTDEEVSEYAAQIERHLAQYPDWKIVWDMISIDDRTIAKKVFMLIKQLHAKRGVVIKELPRETTKQPVKTTTVVPVSQAGRKIKWGE